MAISEPHVKAKARETSAITRLFPKQGKWTEEDYFALPDSNQIVELDEGVLVMPPPPDTSHQSASANLFFALESFNRKNNVGVAFFAPLAIRLWHGKIREPDIVFLLNEHRERIEERSSGAPDLTVEILSPATRKTDLHEKFNEYARARVGEYWIVGPKAKTVQVYTLQDEAYALYGNFGKDEIAKSKLLAGFEIRVNDIFTR